MSALTDARAAVGGLSDPSKMPGRSYNLPARECNVGSDLRKLKGSVCFECYAMKGRYNFSNVQNALYRRLNTIDSPTWVQNMAVAIHKERFFRWHDSGDLQSMAHLLKIVDVARMTPNVRHWLPTKEKALIKAYKRNHGEFPDNLTVRVSGAMVDGKAPAGLGSVVFSEKPPAGVHACPAPSQGGKCRDCRACWDSGVKTVGYKKH